MDPLLSGLRCAAARRDDRQGVSPAWSSRPSSPLARGLGPEAPTASSPARPSCRCYRGCSPGPDRGSWLLRSKQRQSGGRMNVHKNARLTPRSREVMFGRVLSGEAAGAVAAGFGVSERTVYKWLKRWRLEGRAGLSDRSSRPLRQHPLAAERVAAVEALRRQRMTLPAIACALAMPVPRSLTYCVGLA